MALSWCSAPSHCGRAPLVGAALPGASLRRGGNSERHGGQAFDEAPTREEAGGDDLDLVFAAPLPLCPPASLLYRTVGSAAQPSCGLEEASGRKKPKS